MASKKRSRWSPVPRKIRVQDDDVLAEQWVRLTSERYVRGVNASKWREATPWPWRVDVWAAEFVREEPLESEMNGAVAAALRAVAGVKKVAHEDRGAWIVAGDPRGDALVRAAAKVVDRLQVRIRANMKASRAKATRR